MITRIWQEDRRFILLAGSGFAVFLFINSFIGGCIDGVDGPKGLLAQSQKIEREVRALHKELQNRYWDEKSRLESYEKHETALRGDLELSPEKELEKFDEEASIVQFNRAIDRLWGQALEKANRATVAIPEKLGPQDFEIERSDGKKEFERHYAYLGVIRRALSALIDSGMAEIGRPEILPEEAFQVLPGDETMLCLQRGVTFKVAGPYESFLKTLKSIQAPRDFLQVRVDLSQKAAAEDRLIKGELQFVSFRLVEASALEVDEKKKPEPRRRKRR